tara:strand:+ start:846 stop:2210 length:1365 start_codon:yes stop_codon:yes gene_type:complete
MTKNTSKIFFLFLIIHLFVWTLIPSLTNVNLPLDTIEALAWGSNLDWGFNKHPPMSAFAVEFFYQIFGSQDWAYYFLSQIFVVSAFFVVWIFSKEFFKNENYCLISVLLLEGIYFYNFTTPEFNVNVCQLPFWALSVLYAWKGFKYNKTSDWLLFGLFAALGILSKYLFIYLLIAMDVFFLYMIAKKKVNFKSLITLVSFLLVLSPHLIWLTENDYITIAYGLQRTGTGDQNILDHFLHPLIFLGKQIGILIPFFVMFLFLVSKLKTKFNFKDKKLLFLLTINIIPIILMFLTSMIMGVKIRTMWMTPFYLFLGVLFVYLFEKRIDLKKTNKFVTVFLILFFLTPIIYSYVSISKTDKRTDYPGKEIARLVENRWDKNFSNEIGIVVGDEWFGGNLSYHLNSRPKWFNKLDKNLENLGKGEGAIYIGNPKILKEICPGVFGAIKPVGICMIGSK